MHLNKLKKLAGLTESWDDDDEGLSRAERELADTADRELARRGVKVKANADKDLENISNKEKPEAKKEEPVNDKKPEEKKEEPTPKRRGRAPQEGSKAGRAKAWLASNKDAKRRDFISWASNELGMSGAHANTIFYGLKRGLAEGYILRHPATTSYVLGESYERNKYQWVSHDSDFAPLVFESKEEAERLAEAFADYRNQYPVVELINFDE